MNKKIITPHYYQTASVEAFFKNVDEGTTRGLLVLPCGAGKNVTTYLIFKKLREKIPNAKMGFIAHRGKLLSQFRDTCLELDPNLQITLEKAEHRADPNSDIILMSIQSVGSENNIRLDDVKFDLLVIDEVHHLNHKEGMYKNVLTRFGIFDTLALGLTATPYRFDKVALHTEQGTFFQKEIYNYSLRKAVKEKYLCNFRTYQFETGVNLDNVNVSDGDFTSKSLAKEIVNSNRNDIIIRSYNEVCPGKKGIAFCVSVEHARSLSEDFNTAGIKSEYITGRHSPDEQKAIMDSLNTGETIMLCNRLVLPEGIDEPSLECVILAAPTLNWSLLVQEIGRLTRNFPGKEYGYLLDFVDSCSKHDILRVPSVFGLPDSLELHGESVDDLEPFIDATEKCDNKALLRESPHSLDELKTIIKRIELLGLINNPEDIKDFTTLAWVPVGKDKYILSAGENCTAEVSIDSTNNITTTITNGTEKFTKSYTQDQYDLETHFGKLEDYLSKIWANSKALIDKSHPWWKEAPTPAQKRMLTSLGIAWKIYKDLSKGQSAKLISYTQAQGIKPKPQSNAQKFAIRKASRK